MLQKEENCKCVTLEKAGEEGPGEPVEDGLGRGLGSSGYLSRMPATGAGTEVGRDPGCWENEVVLV